MLKLIEIECGVKKLF